MVWGRDVTQNRNSSDGYVKVVLVDVDRERTMSPERTQAYSRVMRTIEDLGPTKLHGLEQDVIRDAADSLIFAASRDEEEARTALQNVEALADQLAISGRWTSERAAELLDDVRGCGPDAPVPATA